MIVISKYCNHILIMCFLFLISCNDKTQSENTNVAQTETQYPESEPQIIQNMSEKEALDFVETWKNIFATHTIDNYIKLYDPVSFVGIKRTYNGQKNTYDYNGWVQNKKNEFRKFSPDVYLENVRVKWINKKGLTKVSFLQTWVSTINGNYADRGEKELVLKKVNDEIYIVREELLYSQRYDEYFYGD